MTLKKHDLRMMTTSKIKVTYLRKEDNLENEDDLRKNDNLKNEADLEN